ncbi:MAG TPA: DUF2157 domain-containing protein [Candidatus Wallbacteria bacterium]|nr:DUF2157 domain-containing protein [Candidatus Wallbacteria bacterium]
MDKPSNSNDLAAASKKDPFNRAGKQDETGGSATGGGETGCGATDNSMSGKGPEPQNNSAAGAILIERKDIDDAAEEGLVIKEFAPGLWNFLLERDKSKISGYKTPAGGRIIENGNENSRTASNGGPGSSQTAFVSNSGGQMPSGESGGGRSTKSSFTVENVIYFFGALIIIAAMTFFIGVTFEKLGGPGIAVVSALYITAFVIAGRTLYFDHGHETPGGLLITIAVCIVPLFIYGVEVTFNFWPENNTPGSYHQYHIWVKSSWIFMEIGTIAAGALALKYFKIPFLTMPIAVSAWYLSMDLTPLLFGSDSFAWEERLLVSCISGIIMMFVAYHYDRRTEKDYSFWLYMFGVIAFWGSLSFMKGSGGEFGKFLYCLINITMIFISVIIQRKVFIVFGGLGVFGYLGYLSSSVFRDFIGFTFALTILGLAIIGAGLFYSKNREYFESIPERIPDYLKRYLPQYRDIIK